MALRPTEFVTCECRLSYVHLARPYARSGKTEDEKYSVTCIMPKSDVEAKRRLDAAIIAAIQGDTEGKLKGIAPQNVKNPVWDGDGVNNSGERFGPECQNAWVFTASVKPEYKPMEFIVDSGLNEILDASLLYSGMYGKVLINVYPYSNNGNRGVAFGLEKVQKTRDGEVLGGGRVASAAEAFGGPVQTDANGFMNVGRVDPFTGQPLPFN